MFAHANKPLSRRLIVASFSLFCWLGYLPGVHAQVLTPHVYGPVTPGENLRTIASEVRAGNDYPLRQIMHNIRQLNPQLFPDPGSLHVPHGSQLKLPHELGWNTSFKPKPAAYTQMKVLFNKVLNLPPGTPAFASHLTFGSSLPTQTVEVGETMTRLPLHYYYLLAAVVFIVMALLGYRQHRRHTASAAFEDTHNYDPVIRQPQQTPPPPVAVEQDQTPAAADDDRTPVAPNAPLEDDNDVTPAAQIALPDTPSMAMDVMTGTGQHRVVPPPQESHLPDLDFSNRFDMLDEPTEVMPVLTKADLEQKSPEEWQEIMERARVYLDLGDFSHARTLLNQVMDSGMSDLADQAQAMHMELRKAESFANSFNDMMDDIPEEAAASEDSQKPAMDKDQSVSTQVMMDVSQCLMSLEDEEISREYKAIMDDETQVNPHLPDVDAPGSGIVHAQRLRKLAGRFASMPNDKCGARLGLAIVHMSLNEVDQARNELQHIIDNGKSSYVPHAKNLMQQLEKRTT